jgi:hypothetical protein
VNQLGPSQRRGQIPSSPTFERHVRRCGPRPVVTFENSVVEHGKNKPTPVILWWRRPPARIDDGMSRSRNRPANPALHPTSPASLTRRSRRG